MIEYNIELIGKEVYVGFSNSIKSMGKKVDLNLRGNKFIIGMCIMNIIRKILIDII